MLLDPIFCLHDYDDHGHASRRWGYTWSISSTYLGLEYVQELLDEDAQRIAEAEAPRAGAEAAEEDAAQVQEWEDWGLDVDSASSAMHDGLRFRILGQR